MTVQQDKGWNPRPGVSPIPKASPSLRYRLLSPKPRDPRSLPHTLHGFTS